MGILSDRQIRNEIKITPFKDYGPKEPGTISGGLTSYGYDVRLGYKFKVFSPIHATVIDPKDFDPKCLVDVDMSPGHQFEQYGHGITYYCQRCQQNYPPKGVPHSEWLKKCPSVPNHLLIPPHSFVLAESLEHFDIPRDVLCVVIGKSTYARCGLIVNVTPGEPEWPGYWTIELSNTTPLPIKVYPGEGIMQCLFFRSDEKVVHRSVPFGQMDMSGMWCERSYKDKKGKYQDQKGLTLPKAENADNERPQ